MKYLSEDDIEVIHLQIIDATGGSYGIRDRGRLEAVVATQRQEVFGQELYPTVFEKAAALMRGIIADHPFIDGNKRTGVLTSLIFLNLQDYDTAKLDDKTLEEFAVRVAVERLDIPAITAWLEQYSVKPATTPNPHRS